MKFDDLEAKMRRLESYHEQRVLDGAWFAVRLDGRSFSKLTEKNFIKPFDLRFSELMAETTQELVREFDALYGYTESDEISLIFRPEWRMFDRCHEKIISLMAASATASFVKASDHVVQFDSRVITFPNRNTAVDYFRWRGEDAARNALNTCCHWTMINAGSTAGYTAAQLERMGFKEKINLLFQHNVDFFTVPNRFRYGIGFLWEDYQKEGFNPKTNELVLTPRRRVASCLDLPAREAYSDFLNRIIVEPSSEPATTVLPK